jgi:hypothetical protein
MKVLKLIFLTEKGKLAINKENEKNKRNWKLLGTIRLTGGKLTFIDGGMIFKHFIFKNMTGDLNSSGNAQSNNMKEKGFATVEAALLEKGCIKDIDYKLEFEEELLP